MRAAFKDFRFARRANNLNLFVQIILGLLLFLMLNFMASRYFSKFDLSDNKKNSLSLESIAYINDIAEPIDIYVTVEKGLGSVDTAQAQRDIRRLLAQYEYVSKSNSKGLIKATYIKPHVETKKLEEIVTRFGKNIENTIIVASKDKKYKVLALSDLYDLTEQRRAVWKGEQVLSSAILSVASKDTPKIYFLSGHGEMSPNSTDSLRGLSEFSSYLKSRNYEVDTLTITDLKQIPEDADMILIAASQVAFLPREINLLKDYLWKKDGRLMVMLSLGSTNGLEEIFYDWGIRSDDSMIVESTGLNESAGGDLIVKEFPKDRHEIVDLLYKLELPLQFGSTRMIRQDLGSPIDRSIAHSILLLSGQNSWAEMSYKTQVKPKFDEDLDFAGPIPLAMLASKTGNNDLGLSIAGGKLIVFGDEDFASNRLFNRLGNATLLSNSLNWLFERESLLNIQSKSADKYSLTLSESDIISLLIRFLILPAFIAIFGLLVLFLRR